MLGRIEGVSAGRQDQVQLKTATPLDVKQEITVDTLGADALRAAPALLGYPCNISVASTSPEMKLGLERLDLVSTVWHGTPGVCGNGNVAATWTSQLSAEERY